MSSRLAILGIAVTVLGPSVWAQPAGDRSTEPLRITSLSPSGANVPPGRQIVLQFDRPVVPIGRMERRDDELPITIEPSLECAWRWIDTSALACQLGDDDAFRPATRYTVTVEAGMAADDGATLSAAFVRSFTTERPQVSFLSFANWLAPGVPVIRVVFNQPVSQTSVANHLYIENPETGRIAVTVEPDENDRTLPRLMPLPGELSFVDFGEPQIEVSEDEAEGREEARRVWLVSPVTTLPDNAQARLRVEPGLVTVDGPLTGDEDRPVVQFDTFPRYTFTGISCTTNARRNVLITTDDAATACNPLQRIGLVFSAPTIATEIRDRLTFEPDLAGGRTDYDPWANVRAFTGLRTPHQRGNTYTVWLPERLLANQTYQLGLAAGTNGPRDEFGRTLEVPAALTFRTDHRPPNFTVVYPHAILESATDSSLPLNVTNLDDASFVYRRLTPTGADRNRVRDLALAEVEDVHYAVPIGLRELLDGRSGAVYGMVRTAPAITKRDSDRALFAEVTPYQVHAKLGHFNTLVWVTELATGEPVRDARVSMYVDRLANLTADFAAVNEARTDADGIALLAGTETLDPTLALQNYRCGSANLDLCPRLFVRVDHDGEMALLPLDYRFEINPFRLSNYTVLSATQPKYGHLQSWGTTAQGVYRAGDTIDYKIWVRDQSNDTLIPAPPGPYRLEIIDPAGQPAHTVESIELSDFGAFDDRFTVPESSPVGWYQFQLRTSFDDTVYFPMRVLVSDFTPASFRVETSLDADLYVAGSEVAVEALASLFSGGAYRDAEARITATLTRLGFRSSNPVAQGFSFDDEAQRNSLQLAQSTGTVDDTGRRLETFAVPDDLGQTMTFGSLRVEAAVRDDRGRYLAGSTTARVLAVDRIVGLKKSQWVFSEDEPAAVESIVVDVDGNPVAGTAVDIRIDRLETRATRVRGAGNAFLTEYVDEWIAVAACNNTSGTSGTVPENCEFLPEDPGRYRIRATIEDTAGREHATELTAWVRGKGQVVWNSGNDSALEVIPEQTEYAVGDNARYLVQNPYPGATALITIERYGVIRQWVETFETSTPIVEFEIEPDDLPGFYLSILVTSPRVDAPMPARGELDLGKPTYRMAYVNVPVTDPYKQLDIEVSTNQQSYRPRDTVSVEIHARPRNRELREPIEVAVVVLDEAVLDLIQGGTDYYDLYRGFNGLDGLDLRNFGLLTRLVGRQRIELKGANPGGDGGAALSMRSQFRFVAHFEPSLELDRRGRGEFSFELPDNLTGWRVLVLGATPTDRMGLGENAFTVTQPIEIRPLMPNQVSEGDTFNAGASVMNRTDQARVLNVRIEAEGDLNAPALNEDTLVLEPFERGEFYLPLTAARLPVTRDRNAGSVRLSITASDADEGDGLTHELPVLKRRVLQSAANFGSLTDAAATETLAFPENILTDAGEVGVELYASVIGNLDGVFRAARDSAYLFWELMLTKAVMASHYQTLGDYLADDTEWTGSATLTGATLAQAASYQAPNGGMTWLVPRDEIVSPYLSAYTALAFSWLRRDGHEIPAAVEDKLLNYLDTFLRREIMPDFYNRGMTATVRAVALAALAERGELTPADLARYREHVDYMSLFGKAHYLMAAAATPGGEAIAAEVGEIIMQSSTRSAGKLSFNERLDDGYTRILATPMRAQCAALSALVKSPASMDGTAAFALVRTITESRGARTQWENAQENVFCMNALIDYAQRFESDSPMIAATAVIDDRSLGNADFDDVRDDAISLMRAIEPADPGARRELRVGASGPGRLYYTARMSYADAANSTSRVNAGIDVRRELSVERNGEWVLLNGPQTVEQGELVRVDLFVSLPTARQFVVIDDPVPGGLEPVNRDLANASVVDAEAGDFQAAGGSWYFQFSDWQHYSVSRYSFNLRELRHDAARFYADYLPPGNYLLSYTAQAIAAGVFGHPPVTVIEAYDPDVYGQGLTGSLMVTPR